MLDRDTNSQLRSCETAKTSDKGSVATMKCKYITKVKETFRNDKAHRKNNKVSVHVVRCVQTVQTLRNNKVHGSQTKTVALRRVLTTTTTTHKMFCMSLMELLTDCGWDWFS